MSFKKDREAMVADLLQETREELARADNKIAIILATVGIIVGAVVASVLTGEWTPYGLPLWLALLWWSGSAAFVFAIFVLGFALYPRVGRDAYKHEFVGYFGDIQVQAQRGDLARALDRTVKAPGSRDVDQLAQVSSIVSRKYQLLRLSLVVLGAGTVFLVLVAIGWGVHLALS